MTRRDLKFQEDDSRKLGEVMTKENLITAPEEAQALVMPDFTGKSAAEAARAIEQAGLRLANRGTTQATRRSRCEPRTPM